MEQSPNALWSCLWGSGRYFSYPFGPGSGLSFPRSTLSPSSSENTWCHDFPRHKQHLLSQTAQPLPSQPYPKDRARSRGQISTTAMHFNIPGFVQGKCYLSPSSARQELQARYPSCILHKLFPCFARGAFQRAVKNILVCWGLLCGLDRARWGSTLRNKLGPVSMLGCGCKTPFRVAFMFPWPLQHPVSAKIFLSI